LGRAGRAADAEAALDEMARADGLRPTDGCYLRTVRAHADADDWAAGLRVLRRMRAAGYRPPLPAWKYVIAACAYCRPPRPADGGGGGSSGTGGGGNASGDVFALLSEMQVRGVELAATGR